MAASEDDEKKESFIRERVVGKRRSRRELLVRFMTMFGCFVVLAAVFGAAAGAVFAKVSGAMVKSGGDDTEGGTLSIPRDEELSAVSTEAETEYAEEGTTEESSQESIEDIINNFELDFNLDNYSQVYEELSAVVLKANKAVVTVLSEDEKTDWFDNYVENGVVCSGIIWSITDKEILIAAMCDFSGGIPAVKIVFADDSYADAYIKGYDSFTGLTVFGVDIGNVSARTKTFIESVELGNSYAVAQGEPVVLVGNPAGYIGSSLYRNISCVVDNMMVADMALKGMVIDAFTYGEGNGFVLNYSGELIGIYGKKFAGEFTRAYGVSDLKGIMENLSNGRPSACLGITGRTVSDKVSEQYGLVKGVFVSETIADRPAYMSGIKNGDIIVAVDGESVTTLRALQFIIEAHKSGDIIKVSVMRNGAQEYTELVFDIELGAR